ncbi:hypothetical protein ACFPRL_01555 [Pseudoclavibacter helvolus]
MSSVASPASEGESRAAEMRCGSSRLAYASSSSTALSTSKATWRERVTERPAAGWSGRRLPSNGRLPRRGPAPAGLTRAPASLRRGGPGASRPLAWASCPPAAR